MEAARIGVEHQRQEMPVAVPQRESHDIGHRHPFQRAFRIAGVRGSGIFGDDEEKAQPVFAVLAEAGPADGSAQAQRIAFDARLFVYLATHAGDDVFVAFDLAAQAVVFS